MKTPTYYAFQGAIDTPNRMPEPIPTTWSSWSWPPTANPFGCDSSNTIANVEAVALAGANGSPRIPTFVIGVGSSTGNLYGVAQNGGTTNAFMADEPNMNQQFLTALNTIRGTALACTYLIPSPGEAGTLDFSKVNVEYTAGGDGGMELIPQTTDEANCPTSGDAWYYDNVTSPSEIILCPNTCATVTGDSAGQVDILLGCKTTPVT